VSVKIKLLKSFFTRRFNNSLRLDNIYKLSDIFVPNISGTKIAQGV